MLLFAHTSLIKRIPMDVLHQSSIVIEWSGMGFSVSKNRWETNGTNTSHFIPLSLLRAYLFQYSSHFSFEEAQSIGEAIGTIEWYVSVDK